MYLVDRTPIPQSEQISAFEALDAALATFGFGGCMSLLAGLCREHSECGMESGNPAAERRWEERARLFDRAASC